MPALARRSTELSSETESDFLAALGREIRFELGRHSLTTEWLAFEADLSRSALAEILAGRSNPRVLTLRKLCYALRFKSFVEFINQVCGKRQKPAHRRKLCHPPRAKLPIGKRRAA